MCDVCGKVWFGGCGECVCGVWGVFGVGLMGVSVCCLWESLVWVCGKSVCALCGRVWCGFVGSE